MGDFLRRLYFLFNRGKLERELQNDMEVHREMMDEEGRRDFGNPTLLRERSGEVWGWGWLERLLQDVRYGFRILRKNPGFSLVALLALGLGIGANTALFSVVYGVLLQPLPYAQGNQLVVLRQHFSRSSAANMGFSVKEIRDYREQTRSMAEIEEYHQMGFILLDGRQPSEVRTGVVSAHFFDMMGIKPYLGRFFTEADDTPGADPVLVLSYSFWKSHYGGDSSIIGRHFRMNDKVHTVIGVLPPVPQYPRENDVYMPTVACPFRSSQKMMEDRNDHMMGLIGRLKPGQSLKSGMTDMAVIASRLEKSYPENYPAARGFTAGMDGLRSELTRDVRPMLLVLLATAGLVLLIACANVANLALARMMRREQELAVRAALGASRGRLVRQLLTESTILSLAGGAVGLFLAAQCLDLLVTLVGRYTTRAAEVSISAPVLIFTLLVSVVTGLVFGSVPAFSRRVNLVGALKEGSGATTLKIDTNRMRNLLAMGQVAISFMLLIGAGLMIRSFIKLQNVDPGFHGGHVLTANVPLNFTRYPHQQERKVFFDRLVPKLESLPGVQAVAINSGAPLSPGSPFKQPFSIENRPAPGKESRPEANIEVASADAFRLLGVPLISGRFFNADDINKDHPVVIISRGLARDYFPNQDPIGQRIKVDMDEHWFTIAGVVGDVKQYGLDKDPVDTLYAPFSLYPDGTTLMVKTAGDPMSFVPQLQKAVYSVDPEQPVTDVRTLDQLRGQNLELTRLTSTLLGLFAMLALTIAATGLSGVTALLVSQRTREIGIRLALGAQRNEVLRMVVRQSMRVIILGLTAGIVGALLTTRLMNALLFSTPARDPLTFAAVALMFLAVAMLASYIPARRVTRVDPLIALRSE
ncbi:MAG TPA: ABC transporter permease [Candidatus Limnocylindrales bacterium]|nr:ABC transporter permease [Candidatus Limnocylindrales bacterium]